MGKIRVEYGASYAENASKNEKIGRLVGRRSQKKGRSCKKAAPAKAMMRFPGEESGTKAGLRCHRARHATAPLWRKAQSVIAPPERKARRANTRPA